MRNTLEKKLFGINDFMNYSTIKNLNRNYFSSRKNVQITFCNLVSSERRGEYHL